MEPWTLRAWYRPGGADSAAWSIGLMVDGLTAMMLVVVTVVSFLVHVFSIGYMHGDAKYSLFFAWLQMFSVAMLMLVLADNLLLLFIGLGAGGALLLQADRLLVREAGSGQRGPQGLHHHAHRRRGHGPRR